MPLLPVSLVDSCVWSGAYCLVKDVPTTVSQVTKTDANPDVLVMGWDQTATDPVTTLLGQVQLEAMVYSHLHTEKDRQDPDGLAPGAQILLCDITGHGPYAAFVPLSKQPYQSTTNLIRDDGDKEHKPCVHLLHAKSPGMDVGIIPSLIVAVGSDPQDLLEATVAASAAFQPGFDLPGDIISGLAACIQYHCSAEELPSRSHPVGIQVESVADVDLARKIRDCCTNIAVQVYRHAPRRSILQSPTLRERDGMGLDVMVGIKATDRFVSFDPTSGSLQMHSLSATNGDAPPSVLSLGQCTVAPIIDIVTAGGDDSSSAINYDTNTGVKVHAVASFGVVGLVDDACPAASICAYRIMPSAAVYGPNEAGEPGSTHGHVGVVAELETAGSGSLLLMCKAAGGISEVLVNGQPANWHYDKDSGAVRIDVPKCGGGKKGKAGKPPRYNTIDVIV